MEHSVNNQEINLPYPIAFAREFSPGAFRCDALCADEIRHGNTGSPAFAEDDEPRMSLTAPPAAAALNEVALLALARVTAAIGNVPVECDCGREADIASRCKSSVHIQSAGGMGLPGHRLTAPAAVRRDARCRSRHLNPTAQSFSCERPSPATCRACRRPKSRRVPLHLRPPRAESTAHPG
jgi:hypothetical protein